MGHAGSVTKTSVPERRIYAAFFLAKSERETETARMTLAGVQFPHELLMAEARLLERKEP